MSLALAQFLPRLAARIPHVPLGQWPTPLKAVALEGRTVWIKDEGASNAVYGGNKIRTLEMWFGHAREKGARRIWAIGAYGSNHAIATALHAHHAGLECGAILFPQPSSEWAVENCGALIASGCEIVRVPNVALMPFAAMRIARKERDAIVMPPGGATPIGTIGALSGALELAMQIEAGLAPPPKRIVVGVGSTCTIAGLVCGLAIGHAIGVWRWPVPIVHGVRVTPWPVTAPTLIAELAYRTLARIAKLGGPHVAIDRRELLARFVIDGREIGGGYGRPTPRGHEITRMLGRDMAADSASREITRMLGRDMASADSSASHASVSHASASSASHASVSHASASNVSASSASSASNTSVSHASASHASNATYTSVSHASASNASREITRMLGRDMASADGSSSSASHASVSNVSASSASSASNTSVSHASASSAYPRLDGVYSAKAAAGLLRLHRAGVEPLVFWASKSHALLRGPSADELRETDPALLRWLTS